MAERSIDIIVNARDRTAGVLRGVTNRFASFGKTIVSGLGAGLGIGAGLGLAQGIGEFARESVTAGMDFSKTMSEVRALTNATDSDFTRLKASAMDLGASTAFSATEAATAQAEFAKAGMNVNEILQATPAALNLAAVGSLGMGEAAGITVGMLKGMGMEIDQLPRVVDVMAKAMTTSSADLSQLGAAFKFVGPIAQTAGLELEEVTSAIQVLSNAGIQGEQAGTTMRQVLAKMANPTKEAKAIMDGLGVSFLDAQGQMRPLADIIDNIAAATANMGDAERLGVLSKVFDVQAASGMAALIGAGGGELKRLQASLADSAGTAERIAAMKLDNLSGDVEQFGGAMETLRLEMFNSGEGVARDVVQWMSGVVNNITAAWPSINAAISSGVSATIDFLRPAFNVARDIVVGLVDFARPLVSAYADTLIALAKALGGMVMQAGRSIIDGLSLALDFIGVGTGDVGDFFTWMRDRVIQGLRIITFGLTHWRDVLELSLTSAAYGVVSFAGEVRHWFGTVIPDLVVWFGDNWQTILTDVANFTLTVFQNIGSNIVSVMSSLPDLISGSVSFNDIWTPLTEGFESTLRALPVIADREIGAFEQSLADQRREMANRLLEMGISAVDMSKMQLGQIHTGSELVSPELRQTVTEHAASIAAAFKTGLNSAIASARSVLSMFPGFRPEQKGAQNKAPVDAVSTAGAITQLEQSRFLTGVAAASKENALRIQQLREIQELNKNSRETAKLSGELLREMRKMVELWGQQLAGDGPNLGIANA